MASSNCEVINRFFFILKSLTIYLQLYAKIRCKYLIAILYSYPLCTSIFLVCLFIPKGLPKRTVQVEAPPKADHELTKIANDLIPI